MQQFSANTLRLRGPIHLFRKLQFISSMWYDVYYRQHEKCIVYKVPTSYTVYVSYNPWSFRVLTHFNSGLKINGRLIVKLSSHCNDSCIQRINYYINCYLFTVFFFFFITNISLLGLNYCI